jgi:hypothetical protein
MPWGLVSGRWLAMRRRCSDHPKRSVSIVASDAADGFQVDPGLIEFPFRAEAAIVYVADASTSGLVKGSTIP